jgi:predicted nucleic acid-binding protein
MSCLLDTNILLRIVKSDDPMHGVTMNAVSRLFDQNHELTLVPQCLYEFYVAATRPLTKNGLGLTPDSAWEYLDDFQSLAKLRFEPEQAVSHWKELVLKHQVLGKPGHDAHLVAVMEALQISEILTFNVSDFRRYEPTILVLSPEQIS